MTPAQIEDLAAVGFKPDASMAEAWHWTGSPGIALEEDMWYPCDWMARDIQYHSEGFASPRIAAETALTIYT